MSRSVKIEQILKKLDGLSDPQLQEVYAFVMNVLRTRFEQDLESPRKPWPHSPSHKLTDLGAYLITGATYGKRHYFRSRESLDYLQSQLLVWTNRYDWHLEAWACFSNHYHFIAKPLQDPSNLSDLISRLHSSTGLWINRRESSKGRQVWFNYWETHLSFERSYLARLNYVHTNSVRHGLVGHAVDYPWCSAGWFEKTATPAQVKTVYGIKIDRIKVLDDFDALVDW
jgi:putative transposase